MTSLPAPVAAAIARHTSHPVLGALRTAGTRPLGTLGSPQILAPVWVAVTADRVWTVTAYPPPGRWNPTPAVTGPVGVV